jgi:hypothetical protein
MTAHPAPAVQSASSNGATMPEPSGCTGCAMPMQTRMYARIAGRSDSSAETTTFPEPPVSAAESLSSKRNVLANADEQPAPIADERVTLGRIHAVVRTTGIP